MYKESGTQQSLALTLISANYNTLLDATPIVDIDSTIHASFVSSGEFCDVARSIFTFVFEVSFDHIHI
jgi:hypothetical protein